MQTNVAGPVLCEVHVVRLTDVAPAHESMLSTDERHRADRLRDPDDRRRFVAGAAMVRAVGAAHSSVDPADVVVDRRCPVCSLPHGRPVLTDLPLHLSVSHAGAHVLVAVIGSTDVAGLGVDLEPMTAFDGDFDGIRDITCTSAEAAHVRDASDLLRYWTRKESFLKALGTGIRDGLQRLEISPPDDPPRAIVLDGQPAPAAAMRDLPLPDGHVGAVSVLTARRMEVVMRDGERLLSRLT